MKTSALLVFSSLAFLASTAATPSRMAATHQRIPFETVDQEEVSGFGFFDGGSAGVDLLILNDTTWRWFWAQNTANIVSPPPRPPIEFGREMVIATVLGYQTTGGGPNIRVLEVNRDAACGCLHVLIQDDETPGPTDNITNPFHIIKLEKLNVRSVVFEHQKP